MYTRNCSSIITTTSINIHHPNQNDDVITIDFTTEVQYTYLDCTLTKKKEVKEVTDMILESIWNTTSVWKIILDLIIEIQYDTQGLLTVRT